MRRLFSFAVILVVGIAAGTAGSYWYSRTFEPEVAVADVEHSAAPAKGERKVLHYRNPMGAPDTSPVPKKDSMGMDYIPVYADEQDDASAAADVEQSTAPARAERKVLYYRNPMGAPDTSLVPKKDSMGMDYIPVYADEQQSEGTVKVSLDKIQRTGVKTEKVETRSIVRFVRAVGRVEHDETLLTIVTVRSDGYIEDLFVNKTGQHVKKGEPLFRLYSSQIQLAQSDLIVAMRTEGRRTGPEADKSLEGAMLRLRNLGVPQSRIDEVRKTNTNPRTIDWPSPATGDVIEKKVINGQQVRAGDELYRIADHSRVWIIADVAESDIGSIKVGSAAKVAVRADLGAPIEGKVTFIYPELKPETRTVPVRIEVPNPEQRLKTSMYADVVFNVGEAAPVTAVPANAVIDSGTRQVVLVAKGEGRFEPRAVKTGGRGDGYVEVVDGLKVGEEVVTSATFLIDAESNLRAALQSFTQQETQP
jgi:Cu(I)/Ag(I) efflux system membrane fusion protein